MTRAVAAVNLATAAFSLTLLAFPTKSRADVLDYVALPGLHRAESSTPPAAEARARQAEPSARTRASLATNGVDGTWQEFDLLQVAHGVAVHDASHDRLLSIGGTRQSSWALPLSGPPEWQPLSAIPGPPSLWSDWTVYEPSTGLLYYPGLASSSLEIRALDPLTGGVTTLTPSGAAPSAFYSYLALDEADSRLLVVQPPDPSFGNPSTQVWSLDLSPTPMWSEWTPSGTPPPLAVFRLALIDPVRRRLLLPASSGEIWVLNLDAPPTWQQFPSSGLPGSVGDNPVVFDPASDRFWTLDTGGDPYSMSPMTFLWAQESTGGPAPGARYGAGIALDPLQHRLFVNGGMSTAGDDTHSDAWALSLDMPHTWTQLAPDAVRPPLRGGAGDGYDAARQRLVVFGGSNELGGFRNDTWALDLGMTPQWSPIAAQGTPPPARYFHASAWDDAHDRLVVCGGYYGDTQHPFGDLWALSFGAGPPTWSPIAPAGPAPAARMLANLVYDSLQDRFLLLFGYDGAQALQDVWELRLAPTPVWRQLSPAGAAPATRAASMCVFDAARNRVIIFGGGTNAGLLNDLWALDLAAGDGTWHPIAVSPGPSQRNLGLLRFDTIHDRLLLFGGYGVEYQDPNFASINYLNDSWTLDLGGTPAWHERSPSGFLPPGRDRANGAYDPIHDRLILACGGISGSNDLWALTSGDTPTATLLSLASLDATSARVRIAWAGADPLESATVYRRTPATAWRSLGTVVADGRGMIEFEDRDVTPGATYEYRLGVLSQSGEAFYGATWVEIPRFALALSARSSKGDVTFTVQLSANEPATLAVFDLAGRRVWSREVGSLGAGSHEVRADDVALAPALYFARLTQGRETRFARIAVTR